METCFWKQCQFCSFTRIYRCKKDGTKYKSVTNIGNKPTVGEFGKNAETHVFGFDGNLYGKDVTIEFIHFLRPEFKFDSIEELEAQIAKDCEEAEKYIC